MCKKTGSGTAKQKQFNPEETPCTEIIGTIHDRHNRENAMKDVQIRST